MWRFLTLRKEWIRAGVAFSNTWKSSRTRCASLPMQMWSRRPATVTNVPNGWASRAIDPSEAFMTEKIFHYEDQYSRLAWKHTFHYELGVNPASHLRLSWGSLENLGSRIKAAPQKSLSLVLLLCCQGTERWGDNRKWFHLRFPFTTQRLWDGTPPRVHQESGSTNAAQETKDKLFQWEASQIPDELTRYSLSGSSNASEKKKQLQAELRYLVVFDKILIHWTSIITELEY